MGLTPSACGAEKALPLCLQACTDMQPCFGFQFLKLKVQFYTGLI